ncbi:uncharacterized protein Z518_09338 [Rhinocladiella mackenziei CBS 650.93]|uniref:NACHT domain-containing protein n=1 Tax=Rhinocladiella mackenziei CBS 650.93 TaxID=1442369 RepID=A0A0D2FHZ9_9EURO|nr:uncharacterized protein Z518_09338 [Rhinocladiella mackenziei CBS 650.93]KIX01612.1 hypothetical protein Z518_09338 [Rhinocladiella mackenziei CBS 650.93]
MRCTSQLSLLSSPDKNSAAVDIVAVHGLTSTTAADSVWLSTSLPCDLPRARILSFGYDSSLRGPDIVNTYARQLLLDLHQVRAKESNIDRPIVFVAHSLGGIIVKKALVDSESSSDGLLNKVATSTQGVVLIDNPNRNSPHLIKSILGTPGSSDDFVSSIQSITAEFEALIHFSLKHIRLVSFFEETPDPISEKIWQSLSSSKAKYQLVLGEIKSLAWPFYGHCSTPSPPENSGSLALAEIEDGRKHIASAVTGTGLWLTQNSAFADWIQSDNKGVFWIVGKPGSGKSTLIKHFLQQSNCRREGKPATLTASYFFDPFGNTFERSSVKFFRALLHQFWIQAKRLECEHDILESSTFQITSQLRKSRWGESSVLIDQLDLLLSELGQAHPLFLVVDALDDCEEAGTLEILGFFRRVLDKIQVKHLRIIVSARSTTLSCNEKDVRVFADQENQEDIATFTRTLIGIHQPEDENLLLRFKDQILEVILEKASGIFLWVSLILPVLRNKTQQNSDVLQTLRNLPTDLDSVYHMVLDHINTDEFQRGFPISQILSWVLLAKRPLSLQEVHEALCFAETKKSLNGADLCSSPADNWQSPRKSVPSLTHDLIDHSWGLLQVGHDTYAPKPATWSATETLVVQFIHHSAKEFLLDFELNVPSSKYRSRSEALVERNLDFARLCMDYCIWCKSVEDQSNCHKPDLEARYPFLDYSATFWFEHLRGANSEVSQVDILFVKHFPVLAEAELDSWSWALKSLGKETHFYHSSSVLHVTSYYNISILLRLCIQNLGLKSEAGYNDEFDGHWDPLPNKIVQPSENIDCDGILDQPDSNGWTPLTLCAQVGSFESAKVLLAAGADVRVPERIHGYSALFWAVAYGHETIVRTLLDYGADVNAEQMGTSPLQLAASRGHRAIVELLLLRDADPSADGIVSAIQDHSTCSDPWNRAMVKSSRLHQSGSETSLKPLTPLHHAILLSDVTMCRQLVDHGAEVTLPCVTIPPQQQSLWLNRMMLGLPSLVANVAPHSCPGSGISDHTYGAGDLQPNKRQGGNDPRKRKFTQRQPTDEDGEADENDWQCPPNKKSRISEGIRTKPGIQYACPFFKYAPSRFGSGWPCSTKGWPDCHRLKEHLYKTHQVYLCPRCYSTFKTGREWHEHLRARNICEVRERDYAVGLDELQCEILRNRTTKRKECGGDEDQYWRQIYKICFPHVDDAHIPSPYFEGEASSRAYHTFLRQELRGSHAEDLFRHDRYMADPLNALDTFLADSHERFMTRSEPDFAAESSLVQLGGPASAFPTSQPTALPQDFYGIASHHHNSMSLIPPPEDSGIYAMGTNTTDLVSNGVAHECSEQSPNRDDCFPSDDIHLHSAAEHNSLSPLSSQQAILFHEPDETSPWLPFATHDTFAPAVPFQFSPAVNSINSIYTQERQQLQGNPVFAHQQPNSRMPRGGTRQGPCSDRINRQT